MSWLLLAVAILAGRAMSLAVHQATWTNGRDGRFARAGALATFLTRARWWPLHVIWAIAAAHTSWDALPSLRPWAVAACVVLAVSAAGRLGSADLGRLFIADRLLVVLLAAGVAFSPVLVYPCLIAACCVQYTGSGWGLSPGYSNLLGFEFTRASVAVVAAWLAVDGALAAAGMSLANADAIAVAAVLGYQASYYAHHAMAKSALGPWIRHNRAQYLPVNAHLRGWCPRGLPRRLLLAAAGGIARFRMPICAAVWLLEMGWLLVLLDARVATALLLTTILFHVAVFALTGLLAWQFAVSHLAMLCWVVPRAADAFAPSHALAAAVCALLALGWAGALRRRVLRHCQATGRPGRAAGFTDAADHFMAWWDSPYMRMYSWQGETRDGRRVSIPVTALSPHDTVLTDIHTHLMILGMHDDLDPRARHERRTLRAGVWGILVDRDARDFIYRLADGDDPEPAELRFPQTRPWCYRPGEAAPPEIEALRALFLGINARVPSRWFRLAMCWPHCPGEDLVPDICPVAGVTPPRHRFDVPLKSVSLMRVRVFQHRTGVRLLENSVAGTLPLE